MADILIRGMEMPPGCGACPCSIYGECDVIKPRRPLKQYRWSADERPDWCPLIALPEGHGRLIEADALKDMMLDALNDALPECRDEKQRQLMRNTTIAFSADIDEAPTIVPAEEVTP